MLAVPVLFGPFRKSVLIKSRFVQMRQLLSFDPNRPVFVTEGLVRNPQVIERAMFPKSFGKSVTYHILLSPAIQFLEGFTVVLVSLDPLPMPCQRGS
jgi:hypothetical protein